MDAPVEIVGSTERSPLPRQPLWPRRMLWAAGMLVVAIIAALAFGAYRQPDLLLNLMGLRYCG